MHSDRAAAVRDAINGCPVVAADADRSEYSGEPFTTTSGGVETTYVGEFVRLTDFWYRPAYIKQSGTVGDGDGETRPVFVVVLEPLWCTTTDVRQLPPAIIYEVAKHDCGLRVYPAAHRLGPAIWVVDHIGASLTTSADDRCAECGATYYKLRDGTPECARCGHEPGTETRTMEVPSGEYDS